MTNDGQAPADYSKPLPKAKDLQFTPAFEKEDLIISKISSVVNRIPFLNGVLKGQRSSKLLGGTIDGISTVASGGVKLLAGIPGANFTENLINFFKIPLVFLVAKLAGEQPPIKLSTTVKWFYSVALLILATLAIAIPVTAPLIAIASTATILVASFVSLGWIFRERRMHQHAIEVLTKEFAEEAGKLDKISDETNALNEQLNDAQTLKLTLMAQLQETELPEQRKTILKEELRAVEIRIEQLEGKPELAIDLNNKLALIEEKITMADKSLGKNHETLLDEKRQLAEQLDKAMGSIKKGYKEYDRQKEKLQVLFDKKAFHEAKLSQKNILKIIDKVVKVALSALFVAAAITTLFFPPIGAILIATAGFAGLAYAAVRAAPVLLATVRGWLSKLFTKKEPDALNLKQDGKNNQEDVEMELISPLKSSSTLVMNQLSKASGHDLNKSHVNNSNNDGEAQLASAAKSKPSKNSLPESSTDNDPELDTNLENNEEYKNENVP